MALTERHQRIADWVRAQGRMVTVREILRGIGDDDSGVECSRASGLLRTLCQAGLIQRHQISRHNVKYSGGSNGSASTVSSTSRVCVTDPWGREITEDDARRVMADAVKCYLERPSVRKDPQGYARAAFILGAYMTGRPLPTPQIAPAPVPAVAVHAPTGPARKALPDGWDEDMLAKKIREAERKGRVTYAEIARAVGFTEDFFRNVGAGTQYLTPDIAERVYAVVDGRVS